MGLQEGTTPVTINFHFDPLCPWAWRTALWVREARKVRPIEVRWRLFSLEVLNRQPEVEPDYRNGIGWAALRSLALAHRRSGNEGIEKLYISLGNAQHGHKESIHERGVLEACAEKAGLGADFVEVALADESTIGDVLGDHEEAVKRYHALGVPTIALQGSDLGFFGPVIQTVPRGEEAGEWWDYMFWALQQPNLFELKHKRAGVQLGPVLAE